MLDYKVVKTYVKYESDDCYKVIQLLALSNSQFDIDVTNVFLDEYQSFGDGIHRIEWKSEEEPEHSIRFDDYFSASKHLELLTTGLYESQDHEPTKAVSELLNIEAQQEHEAEASYRQQLLNEKQVRCDETLKFEATCRKTGERKLFSANSIEKAKSLAEIYFPEGVLRVEKVTVSVRLYEGISK
ncbi:hypothetical protein AB6D16_023755 [Vibrio cyclitrophicus]|uniref:hypothetical protein n=1 Tax=Vibrio sp. 10N.261.55.A10 TaxID=3229687 RepID=UPI00354B67F6